jgi:4-amino-4-deoxy-L-arabinose transferase-like glycosyltransferase
MRACPVTPAPRPALPMWIARLLAALVLLIVLAAAYFWLALKWSYSSGERAGWVQKFSHKGWVCKTWEGELALVSLPGSSVEKFHFTVHDDAVAREVSAATGKRVTLHYEEKVGLPTTCFGDTRHFVTRVTAATDIPIGPGVVLPTVPAASAASQPK